METITRKCKRKILLKRKKIQINEIQSLLWLLKILQNQTISKRERKIYLWRLEERIESLIKKKNSRDKEWFSFFIYNVAVVQSKRATLGCCMYTTTSNGRKRALSQNCKCRHRRLLHHCRLTKRKWKFGKNAKRKDEKKKKRSPSSENGHAHTGKRKERERR